MSASAEVCEGPGFDWSATAELVQGWGTFWNERDRVVRSGILDRTWADGATYTDPFGDGPIFNRTTLLDAAEYGMGPGRDALAALIGHFLADRPGEYFEPQPWVEGDGHHRHLRMPWRLCDAAGSVILEGEDVGVLDGARRIREMTGFFDAS